jgi:hypothetical protein
MIICEKVMRIERRHATSANLVMLKMPGNQRLHLAKSHNSSFPQNYYYIWLYYSYLLGDTMEPEAAAQEAEMPDTNTQQITPSTDDVLSTTMHPLTLDDMAHGLSHLGLSASGSSFVYLDFSAKEKDLTDVSLLEQYAFLQNIDLSHNRLRGVLRLF